MNQSNQTRVFLVLFLIFNFLVSAVLLTFNLMAIEQRKQAKRERSEIICILKILPADRQTNPAAVEACRQ